MNPISFSQTAVHHDTSHSSESDSKTQTPVVRQIVSFSFYKINPQYRALPNEEKKQIKNEFVELNKSFESRMIILPYSTIGTRADCDFLIWRIGKDIRDIRDMAAAINKTRLGQYLLLPYSYLSMTKRSVYVDKHTHEASEGRRGTICPGTSEFLFVYPFVKTREWYLLSKEKRQNMMDVHIAVGHKYPSVKINTTYSFGLDDQEFVVAFETNQPNDFLDLVMELRATEGSPYTLRDTPIFTCIRQSLPEILDQLG